MVTTETQAREMYTAIGDFQLKDTQAVQAQFDADKAVAISWWNTLGIDIIGATTRIEASTIYFQIEALLNTETDRFRILVLRKKLDEANEKYKVIKRNG